jgi:hypothetical protein
MELLQTLIVVIMILGALFFVVKNMFFKKTKKSSCGTCSGNEGCCSIKESIGIISNNKR